MNGQQTYPSNIIDFGEWSPDLPALLNGDLITASNCLSTGQGYGQLQGKNTTPGLVTTALNARCQGGISSKSASLASFNFAGNATKLYLLSGITWNDVSRAAPYNTQSSDRWFFTQWGDQIIGTNFTDAIQTYTMGVSALFSNLITSTVATRPTARYITTVKDFVMIANTSDPTDGNRPNRVRWCAIGDPTNWDVSPATQSDYDDLDGLGGIVKQIVGGEFLTILQEHAIWRGTYVGSPLVFQFDLVDKKNGTIAPASVVPIGYRIAFLGADGFYVFDGMNCQNIGENKINRFFFSDLDDSYYDRVVGTAVPGLQLILWTYPSIGSNGICNKMIIFNYASNATKRWTHCDSLNSNHIFQSLSSDKLIINYTELTINQNIAINDNQFKGGVSQLSMFDTDNKMYNLNGDPLVSVMETHDYQITPSRSTDISVIRPVVTGSPDLIALSIGERNNLTDVPNYTLYDTNDSGEFTVRSNARYHKFRIQLVGGFDQFQGVELVKLQAGGAR